MGALKGPIAVGMAGPVGRVMTAVVIEAVGCSENIHVDTPR
jgi:hypothetical protein